MNSKAQRWACPTRHIILLYVLVLTNQFSFAADWPTGTVRVNPAEDGVENRSDVPVVVSLLTSPVGTSFHVDAESGAKAVQAILVSRCGQESITLQVTELHSDSQNAVGTRPSQNVTILLSEDMPLGLAIQKTADHAGLRFDILPGDPVELILYDKDLRMGAETRVHVVKKRLKRQLQQELDLATQRRYVNVDKWFEARGSRIASDACVWYDREQELLVIRNTSKEVQITEAIARLVERGVEIVRD